MAIDIGDAVLTVLADTTQLDQALAKVGPEAAAKMAPAAEAMNATSAAAQGTATAVQGTGAAFTESAAAVETMSTAMAVGQSGAVELGTVTNLAGEKVRESMYEARGEVGLLGEAFGINLPRHVRSFVAELPIIGEALSAAFQVTAILFIIDALAQGIEKLQEWAEHAHKVELAMNDFQSASNNAMLGLADKLLEAGIKVDELKGDHLDALKKELELIDHQSMKELEGTFAALGKAADAVFDQLKTHFYDLDQGSTGAKNAITDFKSQYDLLLSEGKKKEASDLLAGTKQSAEDTLAALIAAKKAAEDAAEASERANAGHMAAGGYKFTGPGDDEIKAQQVLVDVLNKQISAEKEITTLVDNRDYSAKANEQSKIAADATKAATDQIALAKEVEKAQLASIDSVKAEQTLAFNQGKISAADWGVAQLKATNDARLAHQNYLSTVVDVYTKAGLSAKAYTANQDLEIQKIKDATKATEEFVKAKDDLAKNEAAFSKLEVASWKATYDEINKATFAEEILAKVDPFTPQIKRVLDLNNALKALGIQGFLSLNQQLQAAAKAEKLLNDAGIHDGQVWLQVQAAKLKAIIALESANKKAAAEDIKQLKDIEKELKKFQGTSRDIGKTYHDVMVDMGKDLQQFSADLGAEFAAMIAGQESFSDAMEKATAKLIASMAQHWAELYAGKAIADVWDNPGKAAAEFAAAAALETLAGVLGSVGGSSSSGSSSSKTDWQGGSDNSPATQSQAQPTIGQNVPHLAGGGLISAPTLAVVGDSTGGGSAREAVLPLDNAEAMQAIATAIGSTNAGNHTHIHIAGIVSPDNLTKVIKQIDRQVAKRQGRLTAGNSFRLTRRG